MKKCLLLMLGAAVFSFGILGTAYANRDFCAIGECPTMAQQERPQPEPPRNDDRDYHPNGPEKKKPSPGEQENNPPPEGQRPAAPQE